MPPPTPAAEEKRRHGRVDLFAQVQVSRQSEVHIMSTVNISLGGVFISGDPVEYPDLQRGATVDVCIFGPEELGVEDARLRARILRVIPATHGFAPGFGLEFLALSDEQRRALDALLSAARRPR